MYECLTCGNKYPSDGGEEVISTGRSPFVVGPCECGKELVTQEWIGLECPQLSNQSLPDRDRLVQDHLSHLPKFCPKCERPLGLPKGTNILTNPYGIWPNLTHSEEGWTCLYCYHIQLPDSSDLKKMREASSGKQIDHYKVLKQ